MTLRVSVDSLTLHNPPDFLSLAGNTLRGTPPGYGNYPISIVAHLRDGRSVRQEFRIHVWGAFKSIPLVGASVGRSWSYRVRARDLIGGLRLVEGPDFLRLDAETGEVFGVPDDFGDYPVAISAYLDDGTEIQQSFQLKVSRAHHPLGTDASGRDLLDELVRGSRYALLPGVLATCVAVGLGLLLGAYAGFFGGSWERNILVVATSIEAIPAIVLIFLAAAISGFKIWATMTAVGLTILPEIVRSIADAVAQFRRRQFIEAAHELGLRDREILWTEIIWFNLRPLLLTQISRVMSVAILIDVLLTYFGLGPKEVSSWGALLREGAQGTGDGWVLASSAGAIILAVSAFRLLETGLNSRYGQRGLS